MAVSLRVPDDVKKRVARLADAQDFQAFFEVRGTRLAVPVAEFCPRLLAELSGFAGYELVN